MSHNKDTPNQPTTDRWRSRQPYKPDLSGIPSLKDNVYPFQVSLSSYSPSAPPFCPSGALSQASSHLEPRGKQKIDMSFPSLPATSSSNSLLNRDLTSGFECQESFQQPGKKATDPRHPFVIQDSPWLNTNRASIPLMRGEVNPLVDLSSCSSASPLFAPVSLSEGECAMRLNQASSQPSNHEDNPPKKNTDMPFPSLVAKRDFASALEDLDSFLQAPVDDHCTFEMQQKSLEYFGNSSQVPDHQAKVSYDEEQNHVLRQQINTIQASLADERLLREQAYQALEKERRLREKAERAQEATAGRVRELEGKLSAVMQKLKQKCSEYDYLERAHTRLQADVKRADEQAHSLKILYKGRNNN